LLARWENPGWMGTPLVIACLMVGLTCLLAGLAGINNIALCGLLVMLLLVILGGCCSFLNLLWKCWFY
jgi:hypothetical protein